MGKIKRIFIFFIAFPVLVSSGITPTIAKSKQMDREDQLLIINHINVIPMNMPVILPDKTVVIKNGLIVAINDEPVYGPVSGTTVINGENHYLIPGLVDMHVHITSPKDLELFIANGVTAVQNMWGYEGFLNFLGFSNQLRYQKEIEEGTRLGPSIFTSGPVLEGRPKNHPFMMDIVDADTAKKILREQLKKGYDFIKVYDHLSPSVYNAIMEESRELKIPVKGHVPYEVGLSKVIVSGQRQIDHLTGYLDYDGVKLLVSAPELKQYAQLASKHRTYHCPTIVFTQKRVTMERYAEMANHPAMKYLSFRQRFFLRQSVRALTKDLTYRGSNYQDDVLRLYRTVIEALRQENVPVLAGTDTGNPFVFSGFSLHEELELLVKIGLSPFEALECATVKAYESLNLNSQIGTIEVGKKADLVILRKNPLEKIENTKEIEWVILKGKLLDRRDLDELLP